MSTRFLFRYKSSNDNNYLVLAEMIGVLAPMSEPVTLTLQFTSVALVSYLLFKDNERAAVYPDGPRTVPILGNVPQLLMTKDMSMIEFIEESKKQYGNVCDVVFCDRQ